MFPTTITFTQATAVNNIVLERYAVNGNKSEYHFSDHTDVLRHKLEFYRYAPRASAADFGVRKAKVKITKDVTITSPSGADIVKPLVVTLDVSYPVGTPETDEMHALSDIAAIITGVCPWDENHSADRDITNSAWTSNAYFNAFARPLIETGEI